MILNQRRKHLEIRYGQKDPEDVGYLVEYHGGHVFRALKFRIGEFRRSDSAVCAQLPEHAEISSGNERGEESEGQERSAELPGDLPRAKGHVIFHLSWYPRGELLRIIPWERSRPE